MKSTGKIKLWNLNRIPEKIFSLALTILITTILSCQGEKNQQNYADMVFTNAKVYTVDESQPWAEAVAVRDGKIVFVGSSEEATLYIGDSTEVSDLDGKMMLPGFISAHDHLISANWMGFATAM